MSWSAAKVVSWLPKNPEWIYLVYTNLDLWRKCWIQCSNKILSDESYRTMVSGEMPRYGCIDSNGSSAEVVIYFFFYCILFCASAGIFWVCGKLKAGTSRSAALWKIQNWTWFHFFPLVCLPDFFSVLFSTVPSLETLSLEKEGYFKDLKVKVVIHMQVLRASNPGCTCKSY